MARAADGVAVLSPAGAAPAPFQGAASAADAGAARPDSCAARAPSDAPGAADPGPGLDLSFAFPGGVRVLVPAAVGPHTPSPALALEMVPTTARWGYRGASAYCTLAVQDLMVCTTEFRPGARAAGPAAEAPWPRTPRSYARNAPEQHVAGLAPDPGPGPEDMRLVAGPWRVLRAVHARRRGERQHAPRAARGRA